MWKRRKDLEERSLFEGLVRGVPGGTAPRAAQEVFLSAEQLAAMRHLDFDFANPDGKALLGAVGAKMETLPLHGGRTGYAAMGGHVLGVYDDRHRATVAGSRAGKGRSHIIPLLVTDFENSILSIDPKGDLAAETARYRSVVFKQRVAVLDGSKVSGPGCASLRTSFNPLQGMNPNDIEGMVERASQIADALIVPTGREESHWNDTARHLLEGVILHVVTHPDIPRARTLAEVHHQVLAHANKGGQLQEQMISSTAADGAIVGAAAAFFGKEDRERSGTLSTLRKHLHFLGYPSMQSVLADSDLRLEDLLRERMSIYACLPATLMGPCAGFLRMLVNLSLSSFERSQNRSAHQHQTGAHRCVMVLDEFAALGRMDSLATAAGQVAGLGCTLYPILQDLNQLKVYGDKAETFLGNAGTLTFFGNSDTTTLRWIEDRLGSTQVHNVSRRGPSLTAAVGEGDLGASMSMGAHPLMTMSEIARTFDRDDPLARQLVFLPGLGPVIMQRVLYDRHEAFQSYRKWMKDHGAGA